jgi:hypothetical protein
MAEVQIPISLRIRTARTRPAPGELADEAIKGWELEDREDFDRAELIKALDEMRSRLSC